MIIIRTILHVVDNTGLIKVRCFHVMGKTSGTIGSRLIGSAKKIEANTEWSRGDIVRGILVTTKKETHRRTGILIQSSLNGLVIMDKKWDPRGTRITTTIPKELRAIGHIKVIAIASIVV